MWGCGGLTPRGEGVVSQAQYCQHSPHHKGGPVDREPLMWSGVRCVCLLCGALGLATGVCVAPPPPTPTPTHMRTTSSTTQNRSTLNMSHKTACMQTTSHCDNGIQFMQLSLIWLGYGPLSTSDGVLDDSVPFPISLQVALHLCSKLLKMEMGSSLR